MVEDGHIFISYKRENQPFAEELRQQLQQWGYRTWMDVYDIPADADWPDAIQSGLEGADVVIGVMSQAAMKSRPVKNEWDWAIRYEKRLVLLLYENCVIHHNYVRKQYTDFTSDKEKAFIQLKRALEMPITPEIETPTDPYRDYLQNLYDLINQYLVDKIIRRIDDNNPPEPLRLQSERTFGAVDVLFEKREEIHPLFAIGGIQSHKPEQIYDDFEQTFEFFDGRVLLLGEPGAGKTITLLHFARDAVVRRMQDSSLPLPILGIIPDWLKERRPFEEWISNMQLSPKNSSQIIQQGKALLLLDGLDELGGEREDRFISTKHDYRHLQVADVVTEDDGNDRMLVQYDPRKLFMAMLPVNNQIVLTCRVKAYQEIGDKIALKGAVTLKRLDDAQMRAYLTEQPDLWAAVQADEKLRDMLRTPLLLSFFAFAYRDMTDEERQQLRDLSHSPSDLRDKIFETYVRRRYEHEENKLKFRGAKMRFTLGPIYEVLGHISMMDASLRTVNPIGDSMTGNLQFSLQQNYEPFVEEVQKLHLLVSSDNQLRFIHLLLRDYFAFRHSVVCLKHRDHNIRNMAAESLEGIGDIRAVEALIEALKDEHWRVRGSVARALMYVGGSRAVEPLIPLLHDEKPLVCVLVAGVLGALRDTRAVKPLITALHNSNADVSRMAAESLERIGTPEALEAVKQWRREQGNIIDTE